MLDPLAADPTEPRSTTCFPGRCQLQSVLECAGNGRLAMRPLPTGEPWGDYAVSTARWKGALLSDVLALAHPSADGSDVKFEGADRGAYHLKPVLPDTSRVDLAFERALPLALAADPAAQILIAYEMNGKPLRPDHGAPFRVIVPHWYAVASVKWLKRIEVLTEPFIGEFQTGHYMYQWPDRPQEIVSLMRVRARITDEGEWHTAQLEPPIGPYQWQEWSYTWDAADVGRHTLRARATDAAGNVQPEVPPWNRLGYGNNAIEVIFVDIR